jgi:hypothetical protein
MPNAPECQPIADVLAALQNQAQAQLAQIAGLAGADKWKALQEYGALQQQISEQQAQLDQCNQQHAADLTIDISVVDVPGTTGPNRIARAWQLAAGQQTVQQTATVQANTVTFSGILGNSRQSVGVTIEGTDDSGVNGPDFRSGPLPPTPAPPAADPTGQVEIVILSPFNISPDLLSHAAPQPPLQSSLSGINITVTALQFTVTNAIVALNATGNASGLGLSSSFTFQSSVQIAPSYDMAPSSILAISPSTSPKLVMSGMAGSVVQALASTFSGYLDSTVLQQLRTFLNNFITNQVASSLGLSALPSGSVLSVRELTAGADGITVTPVLGAFGTVLSDFQPAPPAPALSLIGLTVQPTVISTSDPANHVAQGRVSLNQPAPAGGITVLVSIDRSDVVAIEPASVLIAEGQAAGTFTATGIPQALASSATIDATVSASLGNQTLTSPLAVRPGTPTTPPVGGTSGSSRSTATTPAPGPGSGTGTTGGGGPSVPSTVCPGTTPGRVIINVGSGTVTVEGEAEDSTGLPSPKTS